ncbi:hypothetical protein JTB14_025465 [Gonioctena quinquepunctata]|nr:hypothetical protein JTB14_025465 [Gonioctena quinquepunctata]
MPNKEKRLPRWYFGGLASAGAACCTHPLDLIKVHLQTQQGGKTSIIKLTKDIVKKQGVLALYSGLSASLLRQLTYSTTRFGMYEVAKQNMKSDSFYARVGIAGIAGAAGGFIGTPADMVNVRMQNDIKLPKEKRRNYKNAIDGLMRVYKEEGVRRLFSGASTASSRAVFMTIGQLSFYDQIKIMLLRSGMFKDNLLTHFLSSLSAGAIATSLTQPLDVLKTRSMNAKPGEFKNLTTIIVYTAKLGPLGFFKGYIPAFVRLAPQTILTFVFLEQLRFNISVATLSRKVRGLHMKSPDYPTILSEQEERIICNGLSIAAEWGFPFEKQDLAELVKSYLARSGTTIPKFKDNRPGESWLNNFLRRHSELSNRFSQSVKESRAAVNYEVINKFFDNLTQNIENVSSEGIINYDETNFTDDPGRVKVIVRKKSKRAEKIMDSSKAATSVMFACTASGKFLPPYIVYKADNLWSTWTEFGPDGARYNRTKSGVWRKILRNWKKRHRGGIRKDHCPRLLKRALADVEANKGTIIKSGFSATGLVPLDRQKILNKLPRETMAEEVAEARIAASLKEVFKNNRFGRAGPSSVGRRKKLEVESGRSITADDIVTEQRLEIGNRSKGSKKTKTVKKKILMGITDTENMEADDGVDNNDMTYNATEKTEVNDFILVKLKTAKGAAKRYVAKITEMMEGGSFPRSSQKIKTT